MSEGRALCAPDGCCCSTDSAGAMGDGRRRAALRAAKGHARARPARRHCRRALNRLAAWSTTMPLC